MLHRIGLWQATGSVFTGSLFMLYGWSCFVTEDEYLVCLGTLVVEENTLVSFSFE